MIVYAANRADFTADVFANVIEQKIVDAFQSRTGRRAPPAEVESWRNSLQYMNNVLMQGEVPDDAGVAIEYGIPLTAKRVDFILTGQDGDDRDVAMIIELKQWSEVQKTDKDAVVRTWVGGAEREVLHPSYQAWTYAALIRDFNEAVQDQAIALVPCAYLHNCQAGDTIHAACYAEHLGRAPAFVRSEVDQLRAFIARHIRRGDRNRILYRIESGRLRPSRSLIDHLGALLQGNREFELIDEQKLVYETALMLASKAQAGRKQVLIVEGGPGTGKSVVAINLLVELTRRELLVHYVTRNGAPRAVFESRLTGSFTKTHIGNLFKGSGTYVDAPRSGLDALVVDEAHRLNEKSGLYKNLGDNQIKEIIEAARASIFFIDEDQRVTFSDIGRKTEIRRWAQSCGADVQVMALQSQFRCNGSDGYLAWLDHTLQIRETATTTLDGIDYDFQVCDSPNELFERILERNALANKSRLVAGYCWPWKGKKDKAIRDIVIAEHDFAMRWNLDEDGPLWLIKPESVNEVGCIHTCQGLELEYVGVIIGADFIVRDGVVQTDALRRASQDSSVRGYRKRLREHPEQARALADRIIKNTYRTLMTRGLRGCYVYCVDAQTNAFFKRSVAMAIASDAAVRWAELRVAEKKGDYE